jgi:hypothetical protein
MSTEFIADDEFEEFEDGMCLYYMIVATKSNVDALT